MRIALTTHSVNPRGGVVHALELAGALTADGHEVTLFAPFSRGEKLFCEPPCRVVLAPSDGLEHDTVSLVDTRIRALKASVKANRPHEFDIFHSQDSISGNALAEMKHEGDLGGYVRTVHHLDHFDNPRLAAWQTRAWRDADRILCVSDMWSRTMLDQYRVQATTVSNGVDLQRYTDQKADNDPALKARLGLKGSPIVLSVGGIEERKNTVALLDAFIEFHAEYPGAQLVIAGGASLLNHSAYSRLFLAALEEANLAGSVLVTGPLAHEDMPALFRVADVLAMVSLREGFGLVVLEALASGTPVVASNQPPFTEYLDQDTCCWATPSDPSSIASALGQVVSGKHRTDFVKAVPELLKRMSWQLSARKHVDIYSELLASKLCPIH